MIDANVNKNFLSNPYTIHPASQKSISQKYETKLLLLPCDLITRQSVFHGPDLNWHLYETQCRTVSKTIYPIRQDNNEKIFGAVVTLKEFRSAGLLLKHLFIKRK